MQFWQNGTEQEELSPSQADDSGCEFYPLILPGGGLTFPNPDEFAHGFCSPFTSPPISSWKSPNNNQIPTFQHQSNSLFLLSDGKSKHDKELENIDSALEANCRLQSFLRTYIAKLRHKSDKLKSEGNSVDSFSAVNKRDTLPAMGGIRLRNIPHYFVLKNSNVPDNSFVAQLGSTNTPGQVYFNSPKWEASKETMLKDEVIRRSRMILLLSGITAPNAEELRQTMLSDHDWQEVSFAMGRFSSANQCEAKWRKLSTQAMSKISTNELKILQEVFKIENGKWPAITLGMELRGLKRRQIEWFKAFKTLIPNQKKLWTVEEVTSLKKWESHYSALGVHNVYASIASRIPYRSAANCMHKFVAIDADNSFGKWDDIETQQLCDSMAIHNDNWVSVSKLVPTRTAAQCRERWRAVNPGIDHDRFSLQDQKRLVGYVAVRGIHDWIGVANCFGNRTEHQCRSKWKGLAATHTHDFDTDRPVQERCKEIELLLNAPIESRCKEAKSKRTNVIKRALEHEHEGMENFESSEDKENSTISVTSKRFRAEFAPKKKSVDIAQKDSDDAEDLNAQNTSPSTPLNIVRKELLKVIPKKKKLSAIPQKDIDRTEILEMAPKNLPRALKKRLRVAPNKKI